jgi:hypothetical protein
LTKKTFPDTVEWPSAGLPLQLFALLPQGSGAFAPREAVVTPGGASFEEVVIPFIEVEETKI